MDWGIEDESSIMQKQKLARWEVREDREIFKPGMMLLLAVIGNRVLSEVEFEQCCASRIIQAIALVQEIQTHLRPKVYFSRKLSHTKRTLQRIGHFETLTKMNTGCEGLLSLLTVFSDNNSFFQYSFSVSHWYFGAR